MKSGRGARIAFYAHPTTMKDRPSCRPTCLLRKKQFDGRGVWFLSPVTAEIQWLRCREIHPVNISITVHRPTYTRYIASLLFNPRQVMWTSVSIMSIVFIFSSFLCRIATCTPLFQRWCRRQVVSEVRCIVGSIPSQSTQTGKQLETRSTDSH